MHNLVLTLILLPALAQARPVERVAIYYIDSFTANVAGRPEIASHRIDVRVKGPTSPDMRRKCQEEKERGRQAM